MTKGLYRDGDWATIFDGNNAIPIPKARYVQQGYEPPFDQLPTKKEYDAKNAKGS